MEWLIAFALGLSAGLHTSTWGMYKDAPHEGFRHYWRSTLISLGLGLTLHLITPLDLLRPAHMAVYWGLIYVCERGIVEFYKGFVRDEDQSKYFIPMQFAVFGKVVENNAKRLGIGIVYAAVVGLFIGGVYLFDKADFGMPRMIAVLTIGSIGGWISAFGGAWKDAPIEGFELFKFFRSPLVAMTFATLMYWHIDNLVYIAFPALGYCIASIETYKTFFFPSVPRGKFAGMPVTHPEMLQERKKFVPLYVTIWVFVIAINAVAIVAPEFRF